MSSLYLIPETDVDILMSDLRLELLDRFDFKPVNETMFYSVQSYTIAWKEAVLTNVYDLRDIKIKAEFQRLAGTGIIIVSLTFTFHNSDTIERFITLK